MEWVWAGTGRCALACMFAKHTQLYSVFFFYIYNVFLSRLISYRRNRSLVSCDCRVLFLFIICCCYFFHFKRITEEPISANEVLPFNWSRVPAGSPSRGGDVAVCISDVNQPSLPTPFYSVLVSVCGSMALSTEFLP